MENRWNSENMLWAAKNKDENEKKIEILYLICKNVENESI